MAVFAEHGFQECVGNTTATLTASIPDWVNRAFVLIWPTDKNTATSTANYYTAKCSLTGPSSLFIEVTGSTGTPRTRVGYCVVWCTEDEFYSEHYSGSMTAGETTPASDPALTFDFADASRRMLTCDVEALSALTSNQVYATAEFNGGQAVEVIRGASGGAIEFSGWAVYWRAETGVEVVTGERDLSGTIQSGVTTVHGSSVSDASRLALFQSFRHEVAGLEQTSIASYLPAGTTIWWERYDQNTSYQSYGRWWVVAFPTGGAAGQHVRLSSIISGAATASLAFSAMELERTMLTEVSFSCNGTGTAHPRDRWQAYLDSTTSLALERWYSGQAAEAAADVMDLGDWRFHRQPHAAGRSF